MLNSLQDLITIDNDDKILGEGAYSEVIRVKSRFDNKIYALKKIDISKLSRSDCQNLKSEIKLHKTLNNPYIIKFHDALQIKNMVYFLLEYANNGCLFFYINPRSGMTEKIALRMFYQICKGIEYLHSQNLIHRDIKPENILIDENFNVKICDFGWSCIVEDGDVRSSICGTFEYMSPEIVYSGQHSQKVDIWCLGILLYEMLHGMPPYVASSMEDIKQELGEKSIVINSNLGKGCKDLLKFILKMDEKERPDIYQILNHPVLLRNLERFKEPVSEEDFVLLMQNYLRNCSSGKRNLPESIEEVFKKTKQSNKIPNFDKSLFTKDSVDRFFMENNDKKIDFNKDINMDFFKTNSQNFSKKNIEVQNKVYVENVKLPETIENFEPTYKKENIKFEKNENSEPTFKTTKIKNINKLYQSSNLKPKEVNNVNIYSQNKFFDKYFKNYNFSQKPINSIKNNFNQNSSNSSDQKNSLSKKLDSLRTKSQNQSISDFNRNSSFNNSNYNTQEKKNSYDKCEFNNHVFKNLRQNETFINKNIKKKKLVDGNHFSIDFSKNKSPNKIENNLQNGIKNIKKKNLNKESVSNNYKSVKNNLNSKDFFNYNHSPNISLKKNVINNIAVKKNSLEPKKMVVSDFKFILKNGVLTKVSIDAEKNENLEKEKKYKTKSHKEITIKKKNINSLKKEGLLAFKKEKELVNKNIINYKFEKKSDEDKKNLNFTKKELINDKFSEEPIKINKIKNKNSHLKKYSQSIQLGNLKNKSLFTNYDFSTKK